MFEQRRKLDLNDDKPSKRDAFRTFLVMVFMVLLALIITGVVVFSCVHGTRVS